MNCIDKCPKGAIRYVRPSAVAQMAPEKGGPDNGRRSFLVVASWLAAGSWMRAQEKKVDGGLAVIEEKKIPERKEYTILLRIARPVSCVYRLAPMMSCVLLLR